MNLNDIKRKHKEFMFPCLANYYKDPIVVKKGDGVWLTGIDDTEYLDFFGGILTVSLGHCNKDINKAVTDQLWKVGHVSTLYQTEGIVDVAEILSKIAPGNLNKTFFTNSGTEANETAVLLAKLHTKSTEIIVLRHSYSGRSQLAINLTGHATWRLIDSSIPGIKHAHAPYCYRCPFGSNVSCCDLKCATDLEELIQTETSGKIAAFMIEPILGVGGFIVVPNEYLKIAASITRKYGGLFISDEVQTGFGRTGEKWFGIEHSEVIPDIMTMAKGIANGFPVGATITTNDIANSFNGSSISTFGGNPVSMAAAKATINLMIEKNVPNNASKLGKKLMSFLLSMKDKYSFIGDVRGKGLMCAIELVEDGKKKIPDSRKAVELMEASKSNNLLIGKGGLYGNVVRIAPPMLIDEESIDEGCRRLELSLSAI